MINSIVNKTLAVIITANVMLFSAKCFSQGAAINTSGTAADASAMLDISSANQGILIPRVSLVQTTSATPITNPTSSLMVYNTSTLGDVTPGFYYWDDTKWSALGGSGISDADLRSIKTKIYTNVGGH